MKQNRSNVVSFVLITATLFVVLPSFKPVRALLTVPLYLSEEDPKAEAAYVMADGHAYWGRLSAAADLYHLRKVDKIIISHEQTLAQYNFKKQKNELLFERAIDYLIWQGVAAEAIETIPVDHSGNLGSLSEARQLVKFKPNLSSVVVVTSAPHTRRSLLCFERNAPEQWKIAIYSDSEPIDSPELFEPLWLEYVKLIVYYVTA